MAPDIELIGQYDSPFVRRVAVALQIYGLGYRHLPWSVWSDTAQVAPYNPLLRVPTLVLDGEVLIESAAILDALDDMVGAERALIAAHGSARRRALRICAFACGAADKAVSLFYELRLHEQPSTTWIERCQGQIAATLDLLEADRAASSTRYWLGDRIGHPDIAVTCTLRFIGEAHRGRIEVGRWPRIGALAADCEQRPELQAVVQPLTVRMPDDDQPGSTTASSS